MSLRFCLLSLGNLASASDGSVPNLAAGDPSYFLALRGQISDPKMRLELRQLAFKGSSARIHQSSERPRRALALYPNLNS
jgi:hypothetical protein